MIPEKLQLRNFMCYGEDVPLLDFNGLHVACLTGHNGAGKSALLDAITWALWGKARAKSDDDLITLGREEMEVALEFLLDDRVYRVIRRRKRGKRVGVTMLNFQAQEASGAWRNLSGDTVSETQDTINRTLRIAYDTFINSAFLVQGRADEFTGRKPTERKQVLGDILALGEYDELERRAKDEANRIGKDLDVVESQIVRLRVEVDERPRYEQALFDARERVAQIETELADHEADAQQLREQASRLQALGEQRNALAQQIERHEQDQHDLLTRLAETQHNVAQFEIVLGRRDEIAAGCAALAAAEAALDEMDQRREEAYRLKDQLKHWNDLLNAMRYQLEAEQRIAHDQLAQLDAQIARRDAVLADRAQLADDLAAVQALQTDLAQLRADEARLVEQQTHVLELQVQIAQVQGVINVRRDALIATQQEQQRRVAELAALVAPLAERERALRDVRGELLRLQSVEDELATRRDALEAATQRQGELQAECKAVKADGKDVAEKLQLVKQGDGTCPVCASELGTDGLAHLTHSYEERRALLLGRHAVLQGDIKANEAEIQEQRTAIERLEGIVSGRGKAEARRAKLEVQHAQASDAQARLVDVQETLRLVEDQLADRDYAQDEQARLHELEAQLAELGDATALKRTLATVRAKIAETEHYLGQTDQLQQQVARLDAELGTIAEAAERRPVALAHYQAITDTIQSESYGVDERRERDAVFAAGQALGYRKEDHVALREQVTALRPWRDEGQALERAQHYIVHEREQLRRDTEQHARLDTILGEQRQQLAQIDLQLGDKAKADLALRSALVRGQQLQRQLAEAQSALGRAHADLERCDRDAAALATQQQRAATLRDKLAIYEELAQAFGKKGVQAMLIETAIPELEQEANELLSRMTDNQFHLAFETQREKKSGDGPIETLDIRISDGVGTRDYQMFSGGEAFRVNFAIRIALSKLLARRAGASLKTLIIDEGFGSQDGKGRDRLVEAINSIQSDFERILVITHIQELKDMFQTQIEITKTPEGSSFAIV